MLYNIQTSSCYQCNSQVGVYVYIHTQSGTLEWEIFHENAEFSFRWESRRSGKPSSDSTAKFIWTDISSIYLFQFFFVPPFLLCSLSTGLYKLPLGSWLSCGRPRNCAVTSTRSAASNAAGLSSMILQSNLIQIIRFYTRQYVISRKVKFKFPAVEFKSMIPNSENGFHL